MTIEYRFSTVDIDTDKRKVSGVAIKYTDVVTLPFGLERFEPRSFETFNDVVLNVQHERSKPLARSPLTMQFFDSDTELRMTAQLPDTTNARDVMQLIKSGVMRGLSTEFVPTETHWEGQLRVIDRAKLVGLTIVDKPAYPESLLKIRCKARPQKIHYRRVVW